MSKTRVPKKKSHKEGQKEAFVRLRRGAGLACGLLLTALAAAAVILAFTYEGAPKTAWPLPLFAAAVFTALFSVREHRFVTAVRLVITVFACFYLLEWFTHEPWKMAYPPQLLNLAAAAGFFLLFTGVFGSFARGGIALGVFYLFVGLANYYTMKFRSSPILPWDLLSLRTALSVTSNYTFSVTWEEACQVLGFVILLGLAGNAVHDRIRPLLRLIPAGAGVAVLVVLVVMLGKTSFTDKYLTKGNLFTQWATYRDNGFMVSFGQNLKYLRIDKPEGYSRQKADAVVAEAAAAYDAAHPVQQTVEEQPDIIIIMNEAFSDLAVLHEFGVSEDYMPFLHSLQQTEAPNVLTGTLFVSVLGGNTANTEYEFLTGGSMAFLPPGSVPYQQYINAPMTSLTKELEELGYRTFASHPYNASGWDRDEVYPFFGFDQSYFRPAFQNPQIIRKYVSDASQYGFIEQKRAEATGPVFSYNVTMQNHGGYSQLYEDVPLTVKLTDISNRPGTEHYLTLVQIADEALEKYLANLEMQTKPVVVVFFGDHQPSDFVANCIMNKDGKKADERTLEEQQKRYQVPFLIWSNRKLTKSGNMEHPVISPNFLGAYTLREAGVELSDYEKYLLWLQEQYPAITANMYIDADGEMRAVGDVAEEDIELLREYEMVCYRRLFDSK